MAHVAKHKATACGHLCKHYERGKDESSNYVKFGNIDIDPERTHLNYNLAPMREQGHYGYIKHRVSEVKCQKRADVNVMCSWVVTAPKEIGEDETEKFFQETYKFLSERYGEINVVSAYVHMDETTPHIHFAFVPVVRDKKKNILKVSAKERLNKLELKSFHGDLSNHMERVFGRDIGILNEATKDGNKSVEELKRGTAQQKLAEIEKAAKDFERLAEENKIKSEAESKKIIALENKREKLEADFKKAEKVYNGKKLTVEKIENIKPTVGTFGIKNVTIEDINNLKKTALGSARKEIALQEATAKIKKLEEENAELKKKIPTVEDILEQNKQKVKFRDFETENGRLKNIINKIITAVESMPEQIRRIILNIIDPPKENRSRTHGDRE